MNIFTILIILVTIVSISNSIPITQFVDGLVNGHEADRGQFPWQVSLHITMQNNQTNNCSGTLLSENWILTAAQCVNNMNQVLIGFGSNHWEHPRNTVISRTVIIHPDFRSVPLNHDIALIQLNDSTKLNLTENIRPILMPGGDQTGLSFEGVKAVSSGWGSTIPKSPVISSKSIQEINESNENTEICLNWRMMSVISNTECKSIYGSTITATTLCTRQINNGGNMCGSDIGGPLIILEPEGWKIIGVASYSQGCSSIQPAIYSRITSYMKWISQITGIEITYF